MADLIIKDTNGKIWKDSTGKILKARKFSETVIQNGLTFWGAADPNYLTLVNGLVSEAYDIRNNGLKMIQNTVSERPYYSSGYLRTYGTGKLASNFTTNALSMFLVLKCSASYNGMTGLGSSISYNLGTNGSIVQYAINNVSSPYYLNNTYYSAATSANTTIKVMHTIANSAIYSQTMTLGEISNNLNYVYMYEWGWYNRVLNATEIIYNINAMMTKHNLT